MRIGGGGSVSPSRLERRQQPRLSSTNGSMIQSTSFANATSMSILNSSSFIGGDRGGTDEQNIRVAARVRPKTPKESRAGTAVHVNEQNLSEGCWPTEMIITTTNAIVHNGKQKFRFDAVFPAHAGQEAVFEEMAAPLVRAVCSGYNATLFAYGQTGTGKTHTMLGEDIWMLASNPSKELSTKQRDTLENSDMRGVIPRAMKLLFLLLRDKQHKVSVSYLEIYNEKILDLLNPTSQEGLEIREDKQGSVQVVDCTVKRVSTVNEVFDYLWKGAKNRAVSSTDMNEHSSRSHTIFQVLVETRGMNGMPGTKAKLNLVDLAGSEKWRPHQLSEFSDQRIMEMTSINQSLSNLGNCVRGLLRPGKNHIPFRNSKLTRLLQDSLGGNALTGFVVTVSPSEMAHEETISTLQFADRVKRVHVKAEMNTVETPESLMKKLEVELAKAREENKELKLKLDELAASPPGKKEDGENSWTAANGSSKIGQVLQKCLAASDSPVAAGGSEEHLLLLSKPEKFLQDYHDHLKQRKPDSLLPAERLALVEWSVCLQSEELAKFRIAVEQSEVDLKAKETQLAMVSKQLAECKSALEVERSKVVELELEKEQSVQEMASLRDKVRELEQQLVQAQQQKAKQQATIFIRNQSPGQHTRSSATSNVVVLPASSSSSASKRVAEPIAATPAPSSTSLRRSSVPVGPESTAIHHQSSIRRSSPAIAPVQQPQQQPQPQAMPSPIPHIASTTKNISFNSSRAHHLKSASSPAGGLLTPAVIKSSSPAVMVPPPPPPSSHNHQQVQVWDRFIDDTSGKPYYHCKETGQTTWKRPGGGSSSGIASNGAMIIVRGE